MYSTRIRRPSRHPIYAINLVNEASVEAGGPDNIACTVEHPTLETSNIMMKHPYIQLIAATGGPGVVTAVPFLRKKRDRRRRRKPAGSC